MEKNLAETLQLYSECLKQILGLNITGIYNNIINEVEGFFNIKLFLPEVKITANFNEEYLKFLEGLPDEKYEIKDTVGRYLFCREKWDVIKYNFTEFPLRAEPNFDKIFMAYFSGKKECREYLYKTYRE